MKRFFLNDELSSLDLVFVVIVAACSNIVFFKEYKSFWVPWGLLEYQGCLWVLKGCPFRVPQGCLQGPKGFLGLLISFSFVLIVLGAAHYVMHFSVFFDHPSTYDYVFAVILPNIYFIKFVIVILGSPPSHLNGIT